MTPTQLSLRYLRAEGYTCEVTERWNAHARIRQDLFGFVDILALRGAETLAVQTTTAKNLMARVHKIAESDTVAAVREAGWTIHVHGWLKKPNGRWALHRVEDVS